MLAGLFIPVCLTSVHVLLYLCVSCVQIATYFTLVAVWLSRVLVSASCGVVVWVTCFPT